MGVKTPPIAISLLLLICTGALAAPNLQRVDRILDRLEEKILNEKGQLYESQLNIPMQTHKSQSEIHTQLKEIDQLARIEKNLDQMENEIKILSSDLLSEVERLSDSSSQDGFVEIGITLRNRVTIHGLAVKLNGQEIFRIGHEDNIWLPTKSFPLFQGPLPPGKYHLTIDGDFARPPSSNALDIQQGNTFQIHRQFTLDLSSQKFKKKFDLLVQSTDSKNIELVEKNLQ